ncbi:MAG: sulfotransferase [Gammaproteobacteria bacterium]|nr:sulfotransferase [Gammaproteobacteria bacterium]
MSRSLNIVNVEGHDTPDRGRKLQHTLHNIRRKRAYLFARYLPDATHGYRPQDIKDVLVVISASRSGSSLFYHLLASHPATLAPQGEEITFYKLAGLGLVGSLTASHAIPNDIEMNSAGRTALALDILRDSGYPFIPGIDKEFPIDRYLVDSVQRLLLQWPEIDFDCDHLYQTARATLEQHLRTASGFDTGSYWLDLLSALIAQGYPVNPYYYDLPRKLIEHRHPTMLRIDGPPSAGLCLEEPPFIVPALKVFPKLGEGASPCLLLKSSSNCYRLEFMQSLYPNARFSFIHLTRNPAAAINGLMDGWLSHGFYSQSLQDVAVLDIKGYTKAQFPWSRYWWNFDSPPGWLDYIDQPLQRVAAFQWYSANKHVLDAIESGKISRYMVTKYEDLLHGETLQHELIKAFEFAHLPQDAWPHGYQRPAPVMAVNPPGARKWLQRAQLILPAIREASIAAVAHRLNYDINAADEFV